MVAPGARAVVEEGQLADVGVDDGKRPEQALEGVMAAVDLLAVVLGPEPFERLAFALELVDRTRLIAPLVDGQDDGAIEELLVDVHVGRREKDHHRPFDAVLLRHEPSRAGVLAGGGDRDLAF